MMDQPFSKSTSSAEKCRRLLKVVSPQDTLGILINADPDALASALALKRFFRRKPRKILIYYINPIKRADNLTFIKHLKIDQQHITHVNRVIITKWAILDSQPHHHGQFMDYQFDIIIDHHPLGPASRARFVDIKEDYGANATIMTEYIRAAKIKPSTRLATALFYGIKTDTGNFVRGSLPNDIKAFRYLHQFTNMNIIKKIESSEITKRSLASFRDALDRLTFLKEIAFVHMGEVDDPDILVMLADFFIRLAEATWSAVSGIYDEKLIIVLRNAGFRGDAGKTARKLFGRWDGFAGGRRSAARAEVPLEAISEETKNRTNLRGFVLKNLKEL